LSHIGLWAKQAAQPHAGYDGREVWFVLEPLESLLRIGCDHDVELLGEALFQHQKELMIVIYDQKVVFGKIFAGGTRSKENSVGKLEIRDVYP
jgi:hypothetical protein